jgi:cytochrome c oxidase subunit III
MPTELLRDKPAGRIRRGPGTPPRGRGGDGGRSGGPRQAPANTGLIAVGAFLAAVTMLFLAFTMAYLARRQEAGWTPISVPQVLWINSAVLLASSGSLEWARRRLVRCDAVGLRQGLEWTAGLGLVFVLGQLLAWRRLAAQGLYVASNPHSSFFYLLTGTHALHLVGGLGALAVVIVRAYQGRYTLEEHAGLNVFAVYWHFMDALWLSLFALLFWV